MTQSLRERLEYHPTPGMEAGSRSMRRVAKRLDAIRRAVDFAEKDVLDLGCSGGYFSFALAAEARNVLGVDGDADVINRNRAAAASMGVNNVEFRHAVLRPELIEELPRVHVTLLLSVFHHLLTGSQAYDWNDQGVAEEAFKTLDLLKAKTDVLVFEMGYPDEGYEWCSRLPAMIPTTREWIVERIFGPEFRSVRIIEAPAYVGLGVARRPFQRLVTSSKLPARLLRRALAIDPRDGRDIFVGSRK